MDRQPQLAEPDRPGRDRGRSQAGGRKAPVGEYSRRSAFRWRVGSTRRSSPGRRNRSAAALGEAKFTAPRKPVYSNTTAAPHADEPATIAKQLAEHLVSPVRFADEIAAMYEAGARVFVEVGPQAVLTGLVGQTLAGRPHLALASDVKSRPGLVQLTHLLGQLLAAGVPANLDRLFQGRGVQPLDLAKLGPDTGKPKPPRRRGSSMAFAAGRSMGPNRACWARRCRRIGPPAVPEAPPQTKAKAAPRSPSAFLAASSPLLPRCRLVPFPPERR